MLALTFRNRVPLTMVARLPWQASGMIATTGLKLPNKYMKDSIVGSLLLLARVLRMYEWFDECIDMSFVRDDESPFRAKSRSNAVLEDCQVVIKYM
jgi:hypothetical protein